jgi:hypothetical protein
MDAIKLVRLALAVITERLLTLIALAMAFVLSIWVMQYPDLMREIMAGFFALFVFIPCLIKERFKPDEGHGRKEE